MESASKTMLGCGQGSQSRKAKSLPPRGHGLVTLICLLPPAELSTAEASCHGYSVRVGEGEGTQRRFVCKRTEPTKWGEGGWPGEHAGLSAAIYVFVGIKR